MNIIQKIKYAYQRAAHYIDDDQWYNFDEYRALVIQHKCAEKLSYMEDEGDLKNKETIKWYKIFTDISFGIGSYIEMCSGAYKMDSKDYKLLEKDWKKAEMLLIKHYKTIWTR